MAFMTAMYCEGSSGEAVMHRIRAKLRCPGSCSRGASLFPRTALMQHNALLSAPASAGGPACART